MIFYIDLEALLQAELEVPLLLDFLQPRLAEEGTELLLDCSHFKPAMRQPRNWLRLSRFLFHTHWPGQISCFMPTPAFTTFMSRLLAGPGNAGGP